MASCGPPASSVCALLSLVLLSCAGVPALAQDRASAEPPSSGDGDPLARLKASREGVLESQPPRGPTSLPTPSEAERRRAFDGLSARRHASGQISEASAREIDTRARAALEKARAGIASEREAMARRIGEALGLEPPDVKAIAGVTAPPAGKAWVPVLFASSSIPVGVLRSYAAQLDRARGVIAFRGMPGGLTRVEPMARLTAEILRLDPGCEGPACAMHGLQVIVDPLLFRQHGVTRVPALTMVPGDPAQPYCEREDDSPRGSHLVVGDAALSGLLEEYARLGGKTEVGDALTRLQNR